MKIPHFISLILFGIILYGCAGVPKEIVLKAHDERTDVFQEVANAGSVSDYEKDGIGHEVSSGGSVSHNIVELVIKAQIKTNLEDYYLFEPKDSHHGKPTYPFLLNIDGQHVVWQMEGHKENTSFYDKAGRQTIDGGPGMRYFLEKKIEIVPGLHKVFIALLGDNYYKEFEVTLIKDTVYTLELMPIYMKDSWRRPSYLRGIKDFEMVLNSEPLTTNP